VSPPGNRPRCRVCEQSLVKSGKTSAGRTRWRCRSCGSSTVQDRPDISRRAELEWFHAWLLKGERPPASAGSDRTLRRRLSWCWRIEVPPPQPTGELHDVVMLDGTYFQDWCLLIATDGHHVLDWQWCDREKKVAWAQILQRWPAPRLVVMDGGTGTARRRARALARSTRPALLLPHLPERPPLHHPRPTPRGRTADPAADQGAHEGREPRSGCFVDGCLRVLGSTLRRVPPPPHLRHEHGTERPRLGCRLEQAMVVHAPGTPSGTEAVPEPDQARRQLVRLARARPDRHTAGPVWPRTTSSLEGGLRTRPSKTSSVDTADCPPSTHAEPRNGS
jgi:hypothetical protein